MPQLGQAMGEPCEFIKNANFCAPQKLDLQVPAWSPVDKNHWQISGLSVPMQQSVLRGHPNTSLIQFYSSRRKLVTQQLELGARPFPRQNLKYASRSLLTLRQLLKIFLLERHRGWGAEQQNNTKEETLPHPFFYEIYKEIRVLLIIPTSNCYIDGNGEIDDR